MKLKIQIVLSVPRNLLKDVSQLSGELLDRMHQLLERNTDGDLNSAERAELDTLVKMAEFSQIVSMAFQATGKP